MDTMEDNFKRFLNHKLRYIMKYGFFIKSFILLSNNVTSHFLNVNF
jgi:hypothetical protein